MFIVNENKQTKNIYHKWYIMIDWSCANEHFYYSSALSSSSSHSWARPPGIPVREFPGISGNRGPPKFPAGIPGNFLNSGGNYAEFIGVLSFFQFLLLIMTF